jgi:hypothetical protein
VVDVTNRAHVHVWLATDKLFFSHRSFPTSSFF